VTTAHPSNTASAAAKRCLPVLFFLVLIAGTANAGSWGPWSASSDAPVILSPADRVPPDRGREGPSSDIVATPFLWLLGLYQNAIGPVNSGRCPMYPTCSQYSVQAIRKHGPAVGIIMTADRLIHELDEQRSAPLVKVGGRYRYEDTVADNDFWWYGK
jgi:putative component of membrane protein insertase Oxa1/YidC/SpoIIIJ protein YidD